ncbi:short-chain dehydrogenase [Moniliophthora roreri MCA 2997]|uniref:Short-chain dehydrogenase n=2 Tax=Moniliophthora roreri TaxID=221103 RepID=V2XU13_MONRO|nr:short-chain dehydrogenase [Moniliophthora roreri MCA 2997]KAI3621359.1 short-chain dehydrogenase [Moniliophthora roreri]
MTAKSNLDELQICNLLGLSGKVALITGGGSGIGLMMAKGFAANGVKTYITGRREDVLQQVHLQYPNILPLRMDVTNKEEIANAAKVIEEKEGKLDILVNNAGIVGPFYTLCQSSESTINNLAYSRAETKSANLWSNSHFFNQYSFESWAQVFNTNTSAPFFVTMAFLDLLKKGAAVGGTMSSVIMISSVTSKAKITYNIPAYTASKAGINYLTTALATEFARNDVPIRVNCISPGTFPSELTGRDEDKLNESLRTGPLLGVPCSVPLRRAGTEKEMASAAIYLASPMSGYTNGNNIVVDGGLHLVNP